MPEGIPDAVFDTLAEARERDSGEYAPLNDYFEDGVSPTALEREQYDGRGHVEIYRATSADTLDEFSDGRYLDHFQAVSCSVDRDWVEDWAADKRGSRGATPVVLTLTVPMDEVDATAWYEGPSGDAVFDRHMTDEKEYRAVKQVPWQWISDVEGVGSRVDRSDFADVPHDPDFSPDYRELSGSME